MTLGAYVALQLAVTDVEPIIRLHVADGLKVPVELDESVRLPVGVVGVVEVSVTVPVQLDPWFTITEAGEQTTDMVVECLPTLTGPEPWLPD